MFDLTYPVEPAVVFPLPNAKNPGRPLPPASERIPIVEANGLVVGQASRENVHNGSKLLHPVVHLHIIDRNSRLFLQKRSMNKDLLPGRWDTAVGGHVDYGELLESALYRETAEELGLRDFNPVLIRTYVWESDVERELVNVFATVGDFTPSLNPEEISEGRYWTLEEIEKNLGKSLFTPNFEQEFTALKDTLTALL